MKSEISKFWQAFLTVQMDLFVAQKTGNNNLWHEGLDILRINLMDISDEMVFFIVLLGEKKDTAPISFLTKGKVKLRNLTIDIISQAPSLATWQYQIGIPPYPDSLNKLCANYKFLGLHTVIYQVYVSVYKISKSSNKLHLIIFVDTNRSFSKYVLRIAVENMLIMFLGDANYYNHIGRFRIIRRKFKKINFSPIEELKNLIEYKSAN